MYKGQENTERYLPPSAECLSLYGAAPLCASGQLTDLDEAELLKEDFI